MTRDMKGRVVLLTGATSGIGRVSAEEIARTGATMVLVARDAARGRQAVEEIVAATGNPKIDLLIADLSSQKSVRALADQFRAKYDRLDVLINNAGAINDKRQVTEDGLELTFAVNHLAYFMLTNLLVDLLKKSAPARVINVASDGYKMGRLNFDDLQYETRGYKGLQAYCDSKLANILFTKELARRLEGAGVTSNCLHPGAVATGFAGGSSDWFGWIVKLGRPFMRSPTKGARTTVHLAISPEVEGRTGGYYQDEKERKIRAHADDPNAARRLWDESVKLTGVGG